MTGGPTLPGALSVAPRPSTSAVAERRRPPIDSQALFAGAREVQIVHAGTVYRLKQTALGKLILTK